MKNKFFTGKFVPAAQSLRVMEGGMFIIMQNYEYLGKPLRIGRLTHIPELARDQIKSKIKSVVKTSKVAKDSVFSGMEVDPPPGDSRYVWSVF